MKNLIDGRKIVILREQKGWSQSDLATHSGITNSVLSRLERDMQADFKFSVVYAIANALDTKIDDLLRPEAQIQVGEYIPILELALRTLSRQSPHAQNQIAKIIQVYIETLENTD